jgi:hypothetical protein
MKDLSRLKGLRALITDAVEQGTSAVERVHKATAARPFDILDKIPPVAPGARGVRIIHDATVAGVYETIRQVNRLVGASLSAALDVIEDVSSDDKAEHVADDMPPTPRLEAPELRPEPPETRPESPESKADRGG